MIFRPPFFLFVGRRSVAYSQQEKADRAKVFKCAKRYLGSLYNSHRVGIQTGQLMMKESADDICNAIRYIYDVLAKDPKDAHGGIGLVPFVIEDSKRYYEKLAYIQANRQNLDGIDADTLLAAKPREVPVRRVPLGRPRSVQLFDLE